MRRIRVNRGLIFDEEGHRLNCIQADRVAWANGLPYAEQFVDKYTGQTLMLNDEGKIIDEPCTDTKQG